MYRHGEIIPELECEKMDAPLWKYIEDDNQIQCPICFLAVLVAIIGFIGIIIYSFWWV